MSNDTILTGMALADALYAKGLHPKGVQLQEYYDCKVYWWGETRKWEPWRDIAAVWHLVDRYDMDVFASRWVVEASGETVNALRFQDIPATIARLVLRLAAQQGGSDA